ncbi:MAG: hypothetical protein AAGA38_00105 [Pseudomonadota bacterium]
MKTLLAASLLIALATPSVAFEFAERDGLWFAGFRQSANGETRELSYTVDMTFGLGMLTIDHDPFGLDKPRYKCRYAFQIPSGNETADQIVALGNNSVECPAPDGVTFKVPLEEKMDVTFPFFDPAPLSLTAQRRPPSALGTLPANYDVLGVSTRQTKAQIEANLIGERGWSLVTDGRYKTQTLSTSDGLSHAHVASYRSVDTPLTNSSGLEVFPDLIEVTFASAATKEGAEAPDAVAIFVYRRSDYRANERSLSVQAIADAVAQKYGAFDQSVDAFSQTRDYNLDGSFNPASSTINTRACVDRSRKRDFNDSARVQSLSGKRGWSDCGPSMYFGVSTDNSGQVILAEFSLVDDPMVVADSFAANARPVQQEVQKVLDANANQGAVPEL